MFSSVDMEREVYVSKGDVPAILCWSGHYGHVVGPGLIPHSLGNPPPQFGCGSEGIGVWSIGGPSLHPVPVVVNT